MKVKNIEVLEPSDLTYVNGVPFVIWCYWEGEDMQGNRLTSFEYLKQNIGVPMALVTPANLQNFLLEEHPLPEVFESLSIVHRSDYVRAYLLHHYGGGWHDIKATRVSFAPVWGAFEDPSVWLIGRPEAQGGAAQVRDSFNRFMPDYVQDLVAVPAWVGRPKTQLSEEILSGIELFILRHQQDLKKYPSRNARDKFIAPKNFIQALLIRIRHMIAGRNPDYPLPWTVFGNFFHPTVLKYQQHVSRELPIDSEKNAGIYHRG